MSIYSGFATRQDQTNYNKLVGRLITTMQEHIIELCQGEIPPHFSNKYSKILARMQSYEQHKYLPPKFTSLLKPLDDVMKNSLVRPTRYLPVQYNVKLQSVNRQMKKNPPMKKSALMNKKLTQKQQIVSQSYTKQNQIKKKQIQRSYSVFSQKKPRLETQFKRTQKLLVRQTMGQFNKNKRRSQLKSSSQSRQKIKYRKLLTQPNQSMSRQKSGTNLREAFIIAANKK